MGILGCYHFHFHSPFLLAGAGPLQPQCPTLLASITHANKCQLGNPQWGKNNHKKKENSTPQITLGNPNLAQYLSHPIPIAPSCNRLSSPLTRLPPPQVPPSCENFVKFPTTFFPAHSPHHRHTLGVVQRFRSKCRPGSVEV